jgi:predicted GNAT superfamily acetyltransferase
MNDINESYIKAEYERDIGLFTSFDLVRTNYERLNAAFHLKCEQHATLKKEYDRLKKEYDKLKRDNERLNVRSSGV